MTSINIVGPLTEYYGNCVWSITGTHYDNLIWEEENTLPKPTLEELTAKHEELVAAQPMNTLRKERDDLLIKTDKYAIPDWPHPTPEARQAWLDYRQALRDLPSVTEDPANPVWPTPPSP